MKHFMIGCCIVWLSVGLYADDTAFRVFTAADGRTIEARVVEYNSSRNKLCIERSNGKKVWVQPTVFSEDDCAYIKEWVATREFLSNSKIRITVDKHKKSAGKKGDDVYYTLFIQNRSKVAYTDIHIAYRLFIEGRGYNKHTFSDSCVDGTLALASLGAGEKAALETKPERIKKTYESHMEESFDEYGNMTSMQIEKKIRDDDVRGIWFRISGPKVEGKAIIRDVVFPADLVDEVTWK